MHCGNRYSPLVNYTLKFTYQVIEYITLVEMDGDESLVLDSVDLPQLLCRHFNERVQNIEKVLVSGCHYLLVRASILESDSSTRRPYYLESQ